MNWLEALRRREEERVRDYGHVRPIIHANYQGFKFVGIGGSIFYAKEEKVKTFHDFLFIHIKKVLGEDWRNREIKKPFEQRHPILKWYDKLCKFQKQHAESRDADGIYSAIPNGVVAAYLNLAYDLYVLGDNMALREHILRRLKNKEQFQGARYELFVTATCIRAGFEIRHEDEADRSRKHAEFVAVHKKTGQQIAIEAKSRHRPGVLSQPGSKRPDEEVRARVGHLLKEAYKKRPLHPYVIFVDVNYPPVAGKLFEKKWMKDVMDSNALKDSKENGRELFNVIVFTNYPHHYGSETEPDPERDFLACFSPVPLVRARYPRAINQLVYAVQQYGHVPHEFPAS